MSSITIPAERAAQVEKVCRAFVAGFLKPFGPAQAEGQISKDDFFASYSPEIHWYDHAFLICRQGHEAVAGLQVAFRHCNQPFKVDIKAITPTAKGAILEQVWIGRHSNDIVRPDGQIAMKASGKDFKCHVCMVMEIDQAGKICRIDEYYNKRWDDGVHESDYAVMKGASLKL